VLYFTGEALEDDEDDDEVSAAVPCDVRHKTNLFYLSTLLKFVCDCVHVHRMNEVALRRARLVLGWVTVFGRVYHHGM